MAKEIQEKLLETISQLVEAYSELRESAEADFEEERDEDEEVDPVELESGVEAALVSEMRVAIESVLDSEDFSPDEFAMLLGAMSDALEEIDPDVFETDEEEEEEEIDEALVDLDESDADLDEDFDDFDDEDDEDEDDEDYYDDDEEEEED